MKKTLHILLAALALSPAAASAQTPANSSAPLPSTDNSADLFTDTAPMMPGIAPTPMPTPRWAVAPQDFNALLVLIQNQTFASNQLPMIQAAALCGYFTCDQCAALMNIFDFDDNKLKVVTYLAPHLIDPIRCQPIMQSLSFISDQQKAWQIISRANP